MADTVRPMASSVQSSEAHVRDETARDNSSLSDHDDEKRDEEKEVVPASHPATGGAGVVAISSPVTGSAGVIAVSSPATGGASVAGLSRNVTDAETPANNVEDEKVAPAEHSIEANEKSATTIVEVSNGGAGEEEEDEEANMVFPSGPALALLTFGLCMATFMVALDNTIIATAIPKITSVFNSLGDVGWYGSSYLLTTTALQPSFGRIYTHFDIRITYCLALFLFEVGSVICAAATSSTMLIVGRAVAGAGASAIFSGGMTIVGFTVPLRKRPIYIAVLSSMFGVASIIGPLLGGAFTDKLSWRWCFWINLPFGAVAIAVVWFFFKPPARKSTGLNWKQKILEIDLLGAFFLICAIVSLLLALQWGGFKYPWSDSRVWGCVIGCGLLVIVFILLQIRRGERATIPLRIFSQRTVLFSCLYSCFLNMAVYTHIFYLPFYFQAVKQTTAVESGIRTIPYLLSVILASVIVGGTVTAIGIFKPFMIIGAAIFTVGAGTVYTLAVDSDAGKWIGYQVLSGFGAGTGVQVPFVAIQVVLNQKDMPTGNALAIFFNSLGGAISVSVAQNIFINGLVKQIPVYAPDVDPFLVFNAGATHLAEVVSAADLPGVLEAYNLALDEAFILPIACGGIAFILSFFVEWKSVKGKKTVVAAV